MAQQTVFLGTVARDGTGDSLRTGGGKINANFTELYTAIATTSGFGAAFDAWFNSLPTTLPGTSGQWWNNGNILTRS